MKNPTLAAIAVETEYYGPSDENLLKNPDEGQRVKHDWKTHNYLIDQNSKYYYPGAIGIKTGFTDQAGECVVSYAKKDNIELIVSIFFDTDPQRWSDAKNLFDYGFNNYNYNLIQKKGDSVGALTVKNTARKIDFLASGDFTFLCSSAEKSQVQPQIVPDNKIFSQQGGDYLLNLSIRKGIKIGSVNYVLNGSVVATGTAYAGENYRKYNFFDYTFQFLTNIYVISAIIALAITAYVIYRVKMSARGRRYGTKYTFAKKKRK